MVDFDFSTIPNREYKDCQDCGQRFRGFENEKLCPECQSLREHPERAPKHWTWTKTGRRWTIAATWPDAEPIPNVGDAVTVHRQDGSSSQETITEVDGLIYDFNGRARLHCWVKQA